MGSSGRISRGFHRLAFFLAAMPLLLGGIFSAYHAYDVAARGFARHKNSACAYAFMKANGEKFWDAYFNSNTPVGGINLKQIGCSDSDYATVSLDEASNPPAFNWLGSFISTMALSLGITLAVALSIYVLVRAIGWVIGGFAAS